MKRMRKFLGRSALLTTVLACAHLLPLQTATAFSDGSGYQILLAVQNSVSELKKQLEELQKVRDTVRSLRDLSQAEALTKRRKELLSQMPMSELRRLAEIPRFGDGGSAGGEGSDEADDREKAAIAQLRQSVEQLSAQEPTPQRLELMRRANERVRRLRQESLIRRHSLSDRQARDVQIQLLLELVSYERERRDGKRRGRETERRYRDGLREFVY